MTEKPVQSTEKTRLSVQRQVDSLLLRGIIRARWSILWERAWPAFATIADKYKDDKDAAASLAQSIQNGSKGKWGRIPMPAHPSLSSGDLKTLAAWVLTVKP